MNASKTCIDMITCMHIISRSCALSIVQGQTDKDASLSDDLGES